MEKQERLDLSRRIDVRVDAMRESGVTRLEMRLAQALTDFQYHVHAERTVYVVFEQRMLDGTYRLSRMSCSRALKGLEDKGVIQREARRGETGGTLVKFNPKYFRFIRINVFLDKPNSWTTELIDVIFPKKPKAEPQRRTRAQMAEWREQQALMDANQVKWNEHFRNLERFPTRKDFDITDNPVYYYQLWVISKAYDRLVHAWMDEYRRQYEEDIKNGIPASQARGLSQLVRRRKYSSIRFDEQDWFGSRNFRAAQRLYNFGKENKINPIDVMQLRFAQFDYANRELGRDYSKFPFLSQLLDYRSVKAIMAVLSTNPKDLKVRGRLRYNVPGNDMVVMFLMDLYEKAEQPFMPATKPVEVPKIMRGEGKTNARDYYLRASQIVEARLQGKALRIGRLVLNQSMQRLMSDVYGFQMFDPLFDFQMEQMTKALTPEQIEDIKFARDGDLITEMAQKVGMTFIQGSKTKKGWSIESQVFRKLLWAYLTDRSQMFAVREVRQLAFGVNEDVYSYSDYKLFVADLGLDNPLHLNNVGIINYDSYREMNRLPFTNLVKETFVPSNGGKNSQGTSYEEALTLPELDDDYLESMFGQEEDNGNLYEDDLPDYVTPDYCDAPIADFGVDINDLAEYRKAELARKEKERIDNIDPEDDPFAVNYIPKDKTVTA